MEKREKVKFTCPHCKNEREREVLSHINADEQPEMRQKVRDLSCFEWRCPICGKVSLIVDPCLYHDMSGQFMVWLSLDEKLPEADGFDPLSGYTLRWVDSPNSFREKIAILELGLDDRAVEIMKLLLMMQLQRTMEVVEVLFHSFDEQTGAFQFVLVLSDGAEQYVSMGAETYTKVEQDVSERLFTPARRFVRIDMDWAVDALELLHEK